MIGSNRLTEPWWEHPTDFRVILDEVNDGPSYEITDAHYVIGEDTYPVLVFFFKKAGIESYASFMEDGRIFDSETRESAIIPNDFNWPEAELEAK